LKETSGPPFKEEIKNPVMEHNPFERNFWASIEEEIKNAVMEQNPLERNFWAGI
jgi:hypothetical protein